MLVQAKIDLGIAYDDAAGRPSTATVPVELGGTTKTPGVYTSPAGTFGITGTLTLDAQGDPDAVFIFKAASTLITASGSGVTLINGAQSANVFWQVGSSATLGTHSTLRGTVMAQASITVTTGVTVDGRTLARTAAVTLDTDTITSPTSVPAPPSTPPATIPLGTAANFAVLAGSTVTNTGPTTINGDLGLSPGTAVTGFPPGHLNGTRHAADSVAVQAKIDLGVAFDDAAGRPSTATVPVELGGTTKTPGVYASPAGTFGITGTLTLDAQGDPDAVFIFKAASTLITASGSGVTLINGARSANVFWLVGSSATLGTHSTLRGTVMAQASITVTTGVTVDGRTLARTAAVTLDTDTITSPTSVPAPPSTPPATIPLGTAANFAVLAGSTVTNTGPTTINGDLGLSPGTAVTGFPPGHLNGTRHAADSVAVQAKIDLGVAFDDAAGRPSTATVPVELGGTTKTPGVYTSPAGTFGITGTLTLDAQGDPDAVFIFKAASTLITASGSGVTLINGARSANVFWLVGSSATLGTHSTLRGTVMAQASITVTTGVTVDGRTLARTAAVTLDTDTITSPSVR